MTLHETIVGDAKDAAKRRDALQLMTLRMLLAAVHNREIEKRGKGDLPAMPAHAGRAGAAPLSDEEVREVVRREVKKRKEAIALYEQGGRRELAEKELQELTMLETYLPPELSREALKAIVGPIVESAKSAGVHEFGKVMGQVMAAVKGKVDAKVVRSLVEELLSGP